MLVIKDVDAFRKQIISLHEEGELSPNEAIENLKLSNLNDVEAYELLGLADLLPSRARALSNTSSPVGGNGVPVKTA